MFVQIQLIFIAAATTLLQTHAVESFQFWGWEHLQLQMMVLAVGMVGWTAFRKVCQQSSHLNGIVVTDLMYGISYYMRWPRCSLYHLGFSLVQPFKAFIRIQHSSMDSGSFTAGCLWKIRRLERRIGFCALNFWLGFVCFRTGNVVFLASVADISRVADFVAPISLKVGFRKHEFDSSSQMGIWDFRCRRDCLSLY